MNKITYYFLLLLTSHVQVKSAQIDPIILKEKIAEQDLINISISLIDHLPKVLVDVIVEYTKFSKQETERLFQSILKKDLESIKSAIILGADINARYETEEDKESFETALHIAIKIKSMEILKYLIEHGANLENLNSKGMTPLHTAVLENNLEASILLIESGANVNAQEKNLQGFTPLHSAVLNNNMNLVIFLIEIGHANMNLTDSKERYPIELADNNNWIFNYLCKYLS